MFGTSELLFSHGTKSFFHGNRFWRLSELFFHMFDALETVFSNFASFENNWKRNVFLWQNRSQDLDLVTQIPGYLDPLKTWWLDSNDCQLIRKRWFLSPQPWCAWRAGAGGLRFHFFWIFYFSVSKNHFNTWETVEPPFQHIMFFLFEGHLECSVHFFKISGSHFCCPEEQLKISLLLREHRWRLF